MHGQYQICISVFVREYARLHNRGMTNDFADLLRSIMAALPGRDKQAELARRLGVEQPTVSRWLNGAEPRGRNLRKIENLSRDLGLEDDIRSEDVAASLAPTNSYGVTKVVGYVGAGAQAHHYAVSQGDLDEIRAPEWASENTVAVEVIGGSLGKMFDRWYVFYDDVRRPVTPDLIGKLCVVGLSDDRVLIKKIMRNGKLGSFDLISNSDDEPPIVGARIEWAAKVKELRQK